MIDWTGVTDGAAGVWGLQMADDGEAVFGLDEGEGDRGLLLLMEGIPQMQMHPTERPHYVASSVGNITAAFR